MADFLGFEKYIKEVKPVFIFGINGAGTTLMTRVMRLHPEIVMLRNTYFFRHFWDIRNKIPKKAIHHILAVTSCLYENDGALSGDQWLLDHYSQKLFEFIREDNPKKIFTLIAYLTYLQHKKKSVMVKCWAERTNNHLYYYEKLKEWFPSCKFVICIRDPRAVITSQLMALRRRGQYPSSDIKHCQDASFDWMRRGKKIEKIKEHYLDDTYINKYEEFVTDPIRRTNDLWRFIDLQEMRSEELGERINSLPPFYQSKTGVKRVSGIDTASVDKWKDILSKTNQNVIEGITAKTAIKMGYDYENREHHLVSLFKKMPPENVKDYMSRLIHLFKKSCRKTP